VEEVGDAAAPGREPADNQPRTDIVDIPAGLGVGPSLTNSGRCAVLATVELEPAYAWTQRADRNRTP
jgi:hypothetical protein